METQHIDKFNCLKSLLEKSAADAIAGQALTTANYGEAISIFKKCFGNEKQIIGMDLLLNVCRMMLSHHNTTLRASDIYDPTFTI